MQNPKIFYLPGAYDGGYWYRGYLPGLYSNQMVCSDFLTNEFKADEISKQVKECDVLVVQRPSDKVRVNIAKYAKTIGKKIIFENDDTYLPDKGVPLKMLANNAQREIAKKMNENLYDVLKITDGVIASTQTLADEYSEVNPNVAICKNCIDPMDEFPCKENTTGKFRIGFVGSVASNNDYYHIKDQLRELDKRDDITIVVFGIRQPDGRILGAYEYDYSFWNSLKNVEWQPYVPMNAYMMTVADLALDLCIIPRQDSYFNRCKSNLKFLEMSLLSIPVLAQGFSTGDSPYQGKEDQKYMTVVVDDNEWYNYIVKIKDDYQKYKDLAIKARDYVIKNYNVQEYHEVWTETIKKLINK